MIVGKMTLSRFNGDEIFGIESATIDHDQYEDGLFATTFRADTHAVAIQALPDTASFRAHPFAEVTLQLSKSPALALRKGSTFAIPKGHDERTHEYHTNFYYYEYQPMDENQITILEREGLRVRARITGTVADVNFYDGSKPRTKVTIEADFTLSI